MILSLIFKIIIGFKLIITDYDFKVKLKIIIDDYNFNYLKIFITLASNYNFVSHRNPYNFEKIFLKRRLFWDITQAFG